MMHYAYEFERLLQDYVCLHKTRASFFIELIVGEKPILVPTFSRNSHFGP